MLSVNKFLFESGTAPRKQQGMSTGAKIGLGLAGTAAIGGGMLGAANYGLLGNSAQVMAKNTINNIEGLGHQIKGWWGGNDEQNLKDSDERQNAALKAQMQAQKNPQPTQTPVTARPAANNSDINAGRHEILPAPTRYNERDPRTDEPINPSNNSGNYVDFRKLTSGDGLKPNDNYGYGLAQQNAVTRPSEML